MSELKELRAEIEAAWTALGVSKEDRETNDDPDCQTLAQSIQISLDYERGRVEMAHDRIKGIRSALKAVRHGLETPKPFERALLIESLDAIIKDLPS